MTRPPPPRCWPRLLASASRFARGRADRRARLLGGAGRSAVQDRHRLVPPRCSTSRTTGSPAVSRSGSAPSCTDATSTSTASVVGATRGRLHRVRRSRPSDAAPARCAANELAVRVVNPLNSHRRVPGVLGRAADDGRGAASRTCRCSRRPAGKQTWYSSHGGLWLGRAGADARASRRSTWRCAPTRSAARSRSAGRLEAGGTTRAGSEHPWPTSSTPTGGVAASRARWRLSGHRGDLRCASRIPEAWDIGRPNLYRADGDAARGRPARSMSVDTTVRLPRDPDRGRPDLAQRATRSTCSGRSTRTSMPTRSRRRRRARCLDEQMRLAREMGLNLLRVPHQGPGSGVSRRGGRGRHPAVVRAAELDAVHRRCRPRVADETLRRMVETMGNHPSIVAWTIINEDWGTRRPVRGTGPAVAPRDVRLAQGARPDPARRRQLGLRDATDTELPRPDGPRRLPPLLPGPGQRRRDGATSIEDFASRPRVAVEPARRRATAGRRAPRPVRVRRLGPAACRPAARRPAPRAVVVLDRQPLLPARPASGGGSRRTGLDRIWPTLDDLAVATQRHQHEALQYEIGQIRRHDSIQGYVITELTDVYWEANGLLDHPAAPEGISLAPRRSSTRRMPWWRTSEATTCAPASRWRPA